MNFLMDAQSFNDMAIFSNGKDRFSVFDLFKKVKTLGGRAQLEAMMRNPSNQIDQLKQRKEAIAFFGSGQLSLLIDHDQFDLILHYIKFDRAYLRANWLDAFVAHVKKKIKYRQHDYVVFVGIKNLLALLKHANQLTAELSQAHVPSYLKQLGQQIQHIVEQPALAYATALAKHKKINFYQLAKLDSTIRRKNSLLVIELLTIFNELDVFETLGKVLQSGQFCLPDYIERPAQTLVTVEGLYHPAIAQPVGNNVLIDEQHRVIFLSGSNMAGKSSLLKSIGMAMYLAHLGFPVPAKRMETVVFDGLLSSINLPDHIEHGQSHYLSEVMRVKKIIDCLAERKKMFVILDELFKGTNAKDAFDASLLVIDGFSAVQHSVFIVSSHITALAEHLAPTRFCFKQLEHLTVDQKPVFTYRLKDGVATDGIGMYFIHEQNIVGLLQQVKDQQLKAQIAAPNHMRN